MMLPASLLPDDYLPVLDEINAIVINSGAPLEGNLFYCHHQKKPGRHNIYDFFQDKRHNFSLFCNESGRLLEVGVNGGHSALLALSQGVEYHGVDICYHAYTEPVAKFLKKTFGNRFHFYKGDSLDVLPKMHNSAPSIQYDLIHIDGKHHTSACRADTLNALRMAKQHAWLLIDDTDMRGVQNFWYELLVKSVVAEEAPKRWVQNKMHAIGRVLKTEL